MESEFAFAPGLVPSSTTTDRADQWCNADLGDMGNGGNSWYLLIIWGNKKNRPRTSLVLHL